MSRKESASFSARGPLATQMMQDVANAGLMRKALEEIRSKYGGVCEMFEICKHRSCNDSYSAWATADEALKKVGRADASTEQS